jgi:two-component system sensor histidine kinase DesK
VTDCPPPTAGARRWFQRASGLFWITIWLVWLANPAASIPELDRPWLAAAGLAGFAVAYVVVMWDCFGGRPIRRQAWLGLGLLTALGIALTAGYGTGPGGWALVLVYVAVAGAAALAMPRGAIGWVAGAVAAELAFGARFGAPAGELVVLPVITAVSGALVMSQRRLFELIGHLHRTRAELAEQTAHTAVTAERQRFSRDLHDLLGHTLSLIVVKAEVIQRSAGRDPAVVAREAGDVQQIGRRALSEVREAVTGYREQGFGAELDAARTALTDAGLQVTVRVTGTPLPAATDRLLAWVVREAATNVVRHSQARHCEIEVRRATGHATVEVRDDGVGGESGPGGRGLTGLAERLAAEGGRLEAGGSDAGGWRLAATVPLPEPTHPLPVPAAAEPP